MKAARGAWLAALAGAAAFLALTRGAILDPGRTDWILRSLDSATALAGWRFFRQAPLAQFPFGANPGYGMEIATSVVYSDSIPLAAFLFKPFAAWLPANFHYFGLWLLACMVLQGLFAYRLLARFSQDRGLLAIGTAFFLVAPVYLARLAGSLSLVAHWLVLAGLCLYFAPRASPWRWILLLCCSALIHAYLLAMAGAVWAADLWQRRWRGEITTRRAAARFAAAAAATLLVVWCAGYFMAGASAGVMAGFGTYRMNLAAPVDPDGLWSRLLPDLPGAEGDYEGFNYLGIGILALAPLAAYALYARRRAAPGDHRSVLPLVAMALALTVLAASNRVALGGVELFAYEIPELVKPAFDVLRGSGRMFWPVYYLIVLVILVLVWRLPRRAALAASAAALAVQVADSAPALRHFAEGFAHPPAWSSPLKSPLWAELGARYRRVVYVLPRNDFAIFLPWALYAADHGMSVNFGYFARVDTEKLIAARNATEAAVAGNRLQPDSLYVFESDALWNIASAQPRPADFVGVVDGFRIIAPGFRN